MLKVHKKDADLQVIRPDAFSTCTSYTKLFKFHMILKWYLIMILTPHSIIMLIIVLIIILFKKLIHHHISVPVWISVAVKLSPLS